MKKIILFCIILISFFGFMGSSLDNYSIIQRVSADPDGDAGDAEGKAAILKEKMDAKLKDYTPSSPSSDPLGDLIKAKEKEASIRKEAERTKSCATSKNCLDKSTFEINTSDFSIGGTTLKDTTAEKTINKTFGVFIKKMMIGLIMLSSFVMTVGAGYMILYFGQDEYLTRGKTIFKMGLVSIIIALSSYYMVNLVTYILYQ